MSFDRPWVLLFALLPVLWAAWEWRSSARRTGLVLKAASLLAVVLALAQPRMTVYESKVAVAVLVDTSASITQQDLARSSALASQIQKSRGKNWVEVLPFARSIRASVPEERPSDGAGSWSFRQTSGDAGRATNLEVAMREAIATLPAGLVPRVALISDGNENAGSIARGMWQAQQLGVPVDTFPLSGRPKPLLQLESVSVPSHVFSGERFPISMTLDSPRVARATIEVKAERKSLGVHRVDLVAGVNRVRIHANVSASGAIDLAGEIAAPGLGEARFEDAVTLRKPRVLLFSQDPVGTEVHLLKSLESNEFEVQRAASSWPDKLDDYQIVVFNNWDMESVPAPRKAALEAFVKQGGGLVWIAGEKNVYVEKNARDEDPLERALPAKLAPPRTPEGTCVVLIVDKSSSMEGKKMELARLAAIGVIDNLRPVDQVGVLIFDNSFQWAVPIRKAEDRFLIKRLVSGITPDGGTQIAPALNEAFRRIVPVNAVYKHIVLLTDGISEEGDSIALAREALNSRVTISTVGLGQDVNRAYLEKVASLSQGKSYFLNDPSGLEQILLRDVMEHTGSTAVEKPARPIVVKKAEILEGVGIESAPALRGYIRFISKPTADTILNADPRDPLLVRWQYGLGRAAVFTSDAKARWASQWVAWPGFDKFWANLFRDLLPHAPASEVTAEFDAANGELVMEYRLGRHVEDPPALPEIYAFGLNGFRTAVKLSKLAAGSYRARVAIGQRQGLFRVRPLADSRAFPEVGFYRQEDELSDYGANEALLRAVSESTGGRFNPAVRNIFDAGGRTISSTMELWPGLLGLAILLNLIEVFLRKWKGLLENLPFYRPATGRAT